MPPRDNKQHPDKGNRETDQRAARRRLPEQHPGPEHGANRDHGVQHCRIGRRGVGQRPVSQRVVHRRAHRSEQDQDPPRSAEHVPAAQDFAPAEGGEQCNHDHPAPVGERDRRHRARNGATDDHVAGPEQCGPGEQRGGRTAIEVEEQHRDVFQGFLIPGCF